MTRPNGCPLCRALAKEYLIDKTTMPVLDTHVGCRCSCLPGKLSWE